MQQFQNISVETTIPRTGLGIRVLGEITEDKLEIVRESDAILRQVIREEGLEREIGNTSQCYQDSISRCYGNTTVRMITQ